MVAERRLRQAPMIQKAPKTVEVSQSQLIDEISDEPIMAQRHVPVAQTGRKTMDVPQVQFPDRVADVPVVSRRQLTGPLIQEEIVEVIRVADSEDLPLNISGETLLENQILRVVEKHVTKCLEMLTEIDELRDADEKFHEQLVKYMKLGIDEDSAVGVKTAEVLRFDTSKSRDERINSKEYADRIKEVQNDVYHIPGESIAMMSSPPEENLRNQGYEVPYMADPMDE